MVVSDTTVLKSFIYYWLLTTFKIPTPNSHIAHSVNLKRENLSVTHSLICHYLYILKRVWYKSIATFFNHTLDQDFKYCFPNKWYFHYLIVGLWSCDFGFQSYPPTLLSMLAQINYLWLAPQKLKTWNPKSPSSFLYFWCQIIYLFYQLLILQRCGHLKFQTS